MSYCLQKSNKKSLYSPSHTSSPSRRTDTCVAADGRCGLVPRTSTATQHRRIAPARTKIYTRRRPRACSGSPAVASSPRPAGRHTCTSKWDQPLAHHAHQTSGSHSAMAFAFCAKRASIFSSISFSSFFHAAASGAGAALPLIGAGDVRYAVACVRLCRLRCSGSSVLSSPGHISLSSY